MKIKDLRELLDKIPVEFDSYNIVNGEAGYLKADDLDTMVYRLDKPIIEMFIDESTKELCFLHQTDEDINKINFDTDDTN